MGAHWHLWGHLETHWHLWGPLGAYGHLWGPMGTYWPLWGPMGDYGDLCGPIGPYGDLWGPIGAYGVGGINFLHTHLDTNPPPPSSKHQIYIRHITHLVVYTAKTTCHIRHQTLYTILPWPYQNSFLGLDFVSSANGAM